MDAGARPQVDKRHFQPAGGPGPNQDDASSIPRAGWPFQSQSFPIEGTFRGGEGQVGMTLVPS